MLRRLVYALSVFLAVLVFGTAGYWLVAGWPPLDALYMTVITMGGVGYREVYPLTPAGQVWTMVVIVAGVGALGFAVITVTDFMVEGHFSGLLEGRRMDKRIAGLSGHHVVAGLGRVGRVVAEEFVEHGVSFVVIDADDDALRVARDHGWAFVRGDATEESTLREAGIERAASLVTALDSDADNVFVTLTARGMAPNMLIVARATTPSAEGKLLRSGADRVITPTEIGGRRMASMVMRPKVLDFLDVVSGGQRTELKIEEMVLSEGDPYVGRTIADAHIRSQTGVYVLAVHGADGSVNSNPDSDTVIQAGDRLLILGSDEQIMVLAGRACTDAGVCYPRSLRTQA
jgi:voltage-gated potassium channel